MAFDDPLKFEPGDKRDKNLSWKWSSWAHFEVWGGTMYY